MKSHTSDQNYDVIEPEKLYFSYHRSTKMLNVLH